MNNVEEFKQGTEFVGNINKANMTIVSKDKGTGTESGHYAIADKIAIIKDLKSGKLFKYGLKSIRKMQRNNY